MYVVNMFDTGQAARTLQEGRFSLAHLLKKYCNVEAQKQFQLADWRIRYVLFYIFHCLFLSKVWKTWKSRGRKFVRGKTKDCQEINERDKNNFR